jgi:hypothetical protein
LGSAIGEICEICGREEPSVDVKLWVKKFYRRKKMCKECMRTARMLKTEGCDCDIEIFTQGDNETNYKIVEQYGKKYLYNGDKK